MKMPRRRVDGLDGLHQMVVGTRVLVVLTASVVMPPVAIDLLLLERLLEIVYRSVKDELPQIIRKSDAD